MKKFTVLLVLIFGVVSVGTAQVQKRVNFSSIPDGAHTIHGANVNVNPNAPMLSPNLPIINRHSQTTKTPVMPSYLSAAELVRAVYAAPQDDSGWIILNAVPGQGFLFGAISQLPESINFRDASNNIVVNNLKGFAQFFPQDKVNRSGKYTIDTVVLSPFQFPNGGIIKPPMVGPVLLLGYAVKANLQSANGWNFAVDAPGLRSLGEVEISVDTINTRTIVDGNNRLQNILSTIIKVPNWEVAADEAFGFAFYVDNTKDSVNLYGTYMTDDTEKDSTKTLGYIIREEETTLNQFLTKESFLGYYNPTEEFRTQFPSMANRAIKANFFCRVGGILDDVTSVETLSDEAANFSLDQVVPNPVQNSSKITFSLQESSSISLRVVNSLGQVVNVLANGALNSGKYSVDFDATELPAGMYYYTLTAGTHSLTRSLVVVK